MLLNRARVGQLTENNTRLLVSTLITPVPFEPSTVLHLFPKNKDVDGHNELILQTYHTTYCTYLHMICLHQMMFILSRMLRRIFIPKDDRNAGGSIRQLGTVHKFQRRGGGGRIWGGHRFLMNAYGGGRVIHFSDNRQWGVMSFFGNPNPKISRFNTRRI